MTETKQFSVWVMPERLEQKQTPEKDGEDKHRRYKRYRAAYANCKCCCSSSFMIGALIGTLIAGIALATTVTMYMVATQKSTTATFTTKTMTTVTTTSATTETTTSSSSSSASTTSTTSATTSTATSTTTTAPYCTTRVTFDDIPSQSASNGVVPNGYNNLNWTNAYYLNASTIPTSGYSTAPVSPDYVAYNYNAYTVKITTANGTRFAFNSVVVSTAWRDNLQYTLWGFRNGTALVSGGFSLFVSNQTIITCTGCSDWDTIYMTSADGTPHSGFSSNTTQFAFDDLCISFGY